jgi:hypothetical protein
MLRLVALLVNLSVGFFFLTATEPHDLFSRGLYSIYSERSDILRTPYFLHNAFNNTNEGRRKSTYTLYLHTGLFIVTGTS